MNHRANVVPELPPSMTAYGRGDKATDAEIEAEKYCI